MPSPTINLISLAVMAILLSPASSFSPSSRRKNYIALKPKLPLIHPITTTATHASLSASDLLYQDQQDALLRRALHEQELLTPNNGSLSSIPSLTAPKVKAVAKSGTGFASASSKSSSIRMAQQLAKVVHKEGVLRIDSVLSEPACDALRAYVLEQQKLAEGITDANVGLSTVYYGVENRRKGRCDLQLSLLRGGFARDMNISSKVDEEFPLADALLELLGSKGTLRHLYEQLVTPEGEFYELASVITEPGSNRQTIHPDLPWKPDAPLYVIFLALQDVSVEMGPTCFLLGTQTQEVNDAYNCGGAEEKDEVLKKCNARLSTLKKGDCVLFDARTLHCGNANESEETRALFNFSFRNPKVKGDLGYKGSMRPGYERSMTLKDVCQALDRYEKGEVEPFEKYGNGMSKSGL